MFGRMDGIEETFVATDENIPALPIIVYLCFWVFRIEETTV